MEKPSGVLVKFSKAENVLFDLLRKNGPVSLTKFKKIAGIPSRKAEAILANLIIFKVILMKASDRGFSYELNPDDPLNINQ
jgi:hypothetical protein